MLCFSSARRWPLAVTVVVTCLAGCCACPCWESLKGEGFPGWSESMGTGVRGGDSAAKPSGFFTDRKSEQIERSLGGGF